MRSAHAVPEQEQSQTTNREFDDLNCGTARLRSQFIDFLNKASAATFRYANSAGRQTSGDVQEDNSPFIALASAPFGIGTISLASSHLIIPAARAGLNIAIFVPTHGIGDVVQLELQKHGVPHLHYRGRGQSDPDNPGFKMCQQFKRSDSTKNALWDVDSCACKNIHFQCGAFGNCSYQKQREFSGTTWVLPTNLLFNERPAFIGHPDLNIVIGDVWKFAHHGVEMPIEVSLDDLCSERKVPRKEAAGFDTEDTELLNGFSIDLAKALRDQSAGQILRDALDGVLTPKVARFLAGLEWRRKIPPNIHPGMSETEAASRAALAIHHNRLVAKLARLWNLIADSLLIGAKSSPYLSLNCELENARNARPQSIKLVYAKPIHDSWLSSTIFLTEIYSPQLQGLHLGHPNLLWVGETNIEQAAITQVRDRRFTKQMFLGNNKIASLSANAARNNIQNKLTPYILSTACSVAPKPYLVVCVDDLKKELLKRQWPSNVYIRNFSEVEGVDHWRAIPHLTVIGMPLPPPPVIESMTRALFGCEIEVVPPDASGCVRFPLKATAVAVAGGKCVPMSGPYHHDANCEEVRKAIANAANLRAIYSVLSHDRPSGDRVRIDLLSPLPHTFEVDKVVTWAEVSLGCLYQMTLAGAVPLQYPDMAKAYPSLFPSGDAARKWFARTFKGRKGGRSSMRHLIIEKCPGFLVLTFRRQGMRGRPRELLYDPAKIDPITWLQGNFPDATIFDNRRFGRGTLVRQ